METKVDYYLDTIFAFCLREGGRGGQLCHRGVAGSDEQEAEPRLQQHQVSIHRYLHSYLYTYTKNHIYRYPPYEESPQGAASGLSRCQFWS